MRASSHCSNIYKRNRSIESIGCATHGSETTSMAALEATSASSDTSCEGRQAVRGSSHELIICADWVGKRELLFINELVCINIYVIKIKTVNYSKKYDRIKIGFYV